MFWDSRISYVVAVIIGLLGDLGDLSSGDPVNPNTPKRPQLRIPQTGPSSPKGLLNRMLLSSLYYDGRAGMKTKRFKMRNQMRFY